MATSIIGTFEETVSKRQNDPAVRFRDATDRWATLTWAEMDELRKAVGSGLIEIGLKPKERVNILSNSSEKWMLADLGIQSTAGETVPIYQSNLPHEVQYIVDNCGAVMIFAEDKSQLDKLIEQKDKIPHVRKVIVFSGDTDGTDWTMTWDELLAIGKEKVSQNADEIVNRTKGIAQDDILTLIYTSGTTGNPKGVVLTHGCMLYEIKAIVDIGVISPTDVQFLFLPMAHVFAKVLQCAWFGTGHEMAIDSETTRIVDNLGEVKPTLMASVPRIFEKVYAKVVAGGTSAPGAKGKLFRWAMDLNDRYAQLCIEEKPIPFALDLQLTLAKKLVFSKVNGRLNELFGGRMRFFVSGGAPLPKKMAYFFANADVTILEGYGLTETSAATCVNRPNSNKIGYVVPPLPGTEIKIAEDGEILIRGPGVMREYWERPEATSEVLIGDGWFATGDIGVIDSEGCLKITDRKKDIIVTAGGKNVAPQNIENLIKSSNSLISQVVIHGDKRKYLTALITLDPDNAIEWAKNNGVSGDYAAITQSSPVRQAIQGTIEACNKQLARYETIKKFRILDRDFEVGEELTPTLKVKRKLCNQKFKDIFDGFYDEKIG